MSSGYRQSRGTRVYVGGLNDGIKKEDLESEFEKYGKLNSVWVAFNPPGFAFIEFANQDEAETAHDNLSGSEMLGSKLRVEISRGQHGGGRGGFRGSRGVVVGVSFQEVEGVGMTVMVVTGVYVGAAGVGVVPEVVGDAMEMTTAQYLTPV